MSHTQHRSPLLKEAFVERLRHEGSTRYHDKHPFHKLMHEGHLTKVQLQQWVLNRYYYQTRIPIKDALIVSKSEDLNFRRKRLWSGSHTRVLPATTTSIPFTSLCMTGI